MLGAALLPFTALGEVAHQLLLLIMLLVSPVIASMLVDFSFII